MTLSLFQHKLVQELAWVIQSPPLISGSINAVTWWDAQHCMQEYQACLPALYLLDRDPSPLIERLETQGTRLGKRFETLVAYWLALSPNYQIIEQNYVLRDKKRTLGEIDFYLQHRATQSRIHLEVAIKFYLVIGQPDQMSHWHGPGLMDRLDKKFQHLVNHQTQLSKKYPDKLPIPIDHQACLLKGRFFYPHPDYPSVDNSPATPVVTADFAAASHLKGVYVEAHELANLHTLIPLPKMQWLSPLGSTQNHATAITPDNVQEPTCYEHFRQDGVTERLFVLPEGFCQTALNINAINET